MTPPIAHSTLEIQAAGSWPLGAACGKACAAGRSLHDGSKIMATIDEELGQIERDIRTLKIEFEQYFGGGRSRPPTDTQWRLETNLKRYCGPVGRSLSSGQRFRYSNLASTYAKYQDMWRKKLIQKESGTTQHHYGAAAKAIEGERQRKAAEDAMRARIAAEDCSENGGSRQCGVFGDGNRPRRGGAAARAAEVRHAAEFALALSDPEHETEKVEKLYQRLVEARTETGEKAGVPSLKDFERFVRQKTKDLKEKGGREIEYTVSIEGGHVKLKARVSS